MNFLAVFLDVLASLIIALAAAIEATQPYGATVLIFLPAALTALRRRYGLAALSAICSVIGWTVAVVRSPAIGLALVVIAWAIPILAKRRKPAPVG